MPPDAVTFVVSTGIGISVIAGVLSGFCYILAQGFTRKRIRKPLLQWHCAVCGNYLRNLGNVKVVICIQCEERVCKLRCSKQEYLKKGWICYTCLKQPSWLQNILDSVLLRYKKINSTNDQHTPSDELVEKYSATMNRQQKDCVRDFIENFVSMILGGSVDDASIYRKYNDKYYDTLFDRYHQDLSCAITNLSSALHIPMNNKPPWEQPPSSAHTNLKFLIEKVLHEAAHLPNLRKTVNDATLAVEREQTYEELLATAILNKIISKQEHDIPSSSEVDSPVNNKRNKEYFLEDTSRSTNLESSSISSLEEYLQSDSSLGSTKYVNRVSLTIQQRIEEPTEVEDVENDFESLQNPNSLLSESDHSNWYLQKRHFYDRSSPVPVPMLVPNPLTSARVLIGDKDVDETSDLSDVTSECDETESTTETQDLSISSRLIFTNSMLTDRLYDNSEQQKPFDLGDPEDVEDVSLEENVNNKIKPTSNRFLDNENTEDLSFISSSSNAEKDSEYLEKYASLPKVVRRSSSPSIRYGRDYYTKQAGLPSGKNKLDEKNNFLLSERYPVQEEINLYKAVPVSTDDRDVEFNETLNSEKPSTELNNEYQNISQITNDSNFDLNSSLVNFYDVINSKIYYQPLNAEQKETEMSVNKKEALLCDSDDFTHQPSIESDINDNQYTTTNKNIPKRDVVKHVDEQIADKEYKNEPNSKSQIANTPEATKTYQVQQTSNDAVTGKNQTNTELTSPSTTVKKLDNTLIKRIYSNPVVRSFALTNREHIPYETEQSSPKLTVKSSQEPQFTVRHVDDHAKNNSIIKTNNSIVKATNSEETQPGNSTFSLEFSDTGSLKEQQSAHSDYNFIELKEKRLVASRLGEFSKSFPNLSKKELTSQHQKNIVYEKVKDEPVKDEPKEDKSLNESVIVEHYMSVKDLKKLFEKNNVSDHQKRKPVHSLTARSISKEMKQKLKSYDGNSHYSEAAYDITEN